VNRSKQSVKDGRDRPLLPLPLGERTEVRVNLSWPSRPSRFPLRGLAPWNCSPVFHGARVGSYQLTWCHESISVPCPSCELTGQGFAARYQAAAIFTGCLGVSNPAFSRVLSRFSSNLRTAYR
jgi:hypothetical protein